MRKVNFYKTSSGNSPVEEFLLNLPEQVRRKVLWTLNVIQELDRVPVEYLKKLVGTDDIWEVRVESAGLAVRILGFFEQGNFVILTNGFVKKSNKTPHQEIEIAEHRKQEYLKRKKIS